MGARSKIEWTEATWNPIRGVKGNWHCTHVSEGCRNCYAERMNVRLGGPAYKPSADEFRFDEKILTDPLRWRRPRMIFVCSMTDLFHEHIPESWIDRIFGMMITASRHTFQVLTKRAGRLAIYLGGPQPSGGRQQAIVRQAVGFGLNLAQYDGQWPLPNVWLGVSAEDQKTADERIPLLLQTPAIVRWVSAEPLLGPIRLKQDWTDIQGKSEFDVNPILHWVVVGGESGPEARPMRLQWVRQLREQCARSGVAFFLKQLGNFPESSQKEPYPFEQLYNDRFGQEPAGVWALADRGKHGDPQQWPEDLRVREYPK